MKENMTTNNKPAFEIFVVREGSNKKSYFTKIVQRGSPKAAADTTPT